MIPNISAPDSRAAGAPESLRASAQHAASQGEFPWSGAIWLAVVALAAWVPALYGRELWHFDEVRWAQVARELLGSKNWFVLRLLGDYYPDKGPLYFWASAGLMKLAGGANEFTPRLLSMLSTLAIGLLVLQFGARRFGRTAGLAAGLLWCVAMLPGGLATSVAVDPFYSLLIVSALLAAAGAVDAGRWGCGRGIAFVACVAAAVFTKGPVGLALPLAALAAAWVIGVPLPRKTWGLYLGAAGASLAICLIWLGIAAREVGAQPILRQAGIHGFGYAARSWSHPEPFWLFSLTFWRDFFPASLLFPAALALMAGRLGRGCAAEPDKVAHSDASAGVAAGWGGCFGAAWRRIRVLAREHPLDFFLLAWFFGIFIFHSAMSGKRSPYIMSAFPAAALLIASEYAASALGAGAAEPNGKSRSLQWAVRLDAAARIVAAGLLFLASSAAAAHSWIIPQIAFHLSKDSEIGPLSMSMRKLSTADHLALWVFAAATLALGIRLLWRGSRLGAGLAGAPLGVAAFGWLALALGGEVAVPLVDPFLSGRAVVEQARPYALRADTQWILRQPELAWLLAWKLDVPPDRIQVIRDTWQWNRAFRTAPEPVLAIVPSNIRDKTEKKAATDMVILGKPRMGIKQYWLIGRGIQAPNPKGHPKDEKFQ